MAKSKKTDLDPAVVAEIASKSTKELEAATGMHARAIESIRDAMAEDKDVIAAKAKYDEVQLKTLAMVWDAPQGFVVPPARMFGAGYTGNHVAHHLKAFVRSGLMRKADDRYVLRDACPACHQRHECAPECALSMTAPYFSPRRYLTP